MGCGASAASEKTPVEETKIRPVSGGDGVFKKQQGHDDDDVFAQQPPTSHSSSTTTTTTTDKNGLSTTTTTTSSSSSSSSQQQHGWMAPKPVVAAETGPSTSFEVSTNGTVIASTPLAPIKPLHNKAGFGVMLPPMKPIVDGPAPKTKAASPKPQTEHDKFLFGDNSMDTVARRNSRGSTPEESLSHPSDLQILKPDAKLPGSKTSTTSSVSAHPDGSKIEVTKTTTTFSSSSTAHEDDFDNFSNNNNNNKKDLFRGTDDALGGGSRFKPQDKPKPSSHFGEDDDPFGGPGPAHHSSSSSSSVTVTNRSTNPSGHTTTTTTTTTAAAPKSAADAKLDQLLSEMDDDWM